jgi:hypothetical protein
VIRCLAGPDAKMPKDFGVWDIPFLVGYMRTLGEFHDELRRTGQGGYALVSVAAKYSERKTKWSSLDLWWDNELLRSSIAGSCCAINVLEEEVKTCGYGDMALKAATERFLDYRDAFKESKVGDNYGS